MSTLNQAKKDFISDKQLCRALHDLAWEYEVEQVLDIVSKFFYEKGLEHARLAQR